MATVGVGAQARGFAARAAPEPQDRIDWSRPITASRRKSLAEGGPNISEDDCIPYIWVLNCCKSSAHRAAEAVVKFDLVSASSLAKGLYREKSQIEWLNTGWLGSAVR